MWSVYVVDVDDTVIPRAVLAPDVKTSALIRDQLEMRLDNDGIIVLYTAIVLRQKNYNEEWHLAKQLGLTARRPIYWTGLTNDFRQKRLMASTMMSSEAPHNA